MEVGTTSGVEAWVEKAIASVDEAQARIRYIAQDEFLCLERFLPPEVLERWNSELDLLLPHLHRNFIPKHKKGGSVAYPTVARLAPTIDAVYRSPSILAFLRRLYRVDVVPCPPSDPHACALYAYTEVGDHMGWHYDNSYYKGRRYTVLMGLRDDSSSRLRCRLYTRVDGRAEEALEVRTGPGVFVTFNGSRLLHSVSPCQEGERRFVISMEYLESVEMNPFLRFVSNMKDAIAYFGFRAIFFPRKS